MKKAIVPAEDSSAKNDEDRLAGYKAPAVHKAFQLLRVLSQSGQSLGIVELAQRLGYSKSTTHGLVHALLREGVLSQGAGGRKLFLGPTIPELLFANWRPEKVRQLAQPALDTIRDAVNETVILGVRIRNRVLILATAEAAESLKLSVPVGSTIPLLAGAVGKVFLAGEPPPNAAALIAGQGLPRFTAATITDAPTYRLELDRVRVQGYAVDREEYLPGIRAVAVALRNRRGLPAALWVVGLSATMVEEKLQQVAAIAMERAAALRHLMDEENGAAALDH